MKPTQALKSKRAAANVLLIAVAAVFSFFSIATNAGQANRQFSVTATLLGTNSSASSVAPTSGFCTKATGAIKLDATIIIVCSTSITVDVIGDPWLTTRMNTYSYQFRISSGKRLQGTIYSYVDFGSETSWRVIDQADGKYLEMLVGW